MNRLASEPAKAASVIIMPAKRNVNSLWQTNSWLVYSLVRCTTCVRVQNGNETDEMKWIQTRRKHWKLFRTIDRFQRVHWIYIYVFAFDIASIELFDFLSLSFSFSLPFTATNRSLYSLTLDLYWFTFFFLFHLQVRSILKSRLWQKNGMGRDLLNFVEYIFQFKFAGTVSVRDR